MGQVYAYPNGQVVQQPPQMYAGPVVAPQAGQPQYLPAFPVLASQIDTHARRVPWYAWLAVGAYVMFRLLKSR